MNEEVLVEETEAPRARPRKAATAFRTISEVADDLKIPQHVLRFWETKFPQLKPLKRGGGRRYYRPEDIALLKRISDLLYTQGYTIKGVQRLLRDGGLEEGVPVPDMPAAEREEERDEAEVATDALREALQVLERLAEELRGLAARN
jgi:DNA-binding transcriptional MerR regulator